MNAQPQQVQGAPDGAFSMGATRLVLACGCFADSIPPQGQAIWLRFPNGRQGGLRFHDQDAQTILERGHMILDGIRAEVEREVAGCPHDLILHFRDDPWTGEHP